MQKHYSTATAAEQRQAIEAIGEVIDLGAFRAAKTG
jgi:hypothetical protein